MLQLMGGGTPGLQGAERSGDEWHIELRTQDDVRGALSALAAADVPVATFEHVKPSLHQIFVKQVGQAHIAARRPEVSRA